MPDVAHILSGLFAGKSKTEAGVAFPAAAYAYVPNADEPSTWKLRLWESPEAKETPRQVGMAIAALGPGGFRGNRAEIPAGDLAAVKAKVRAAWKRVNRDKPATEMPEAIKLAAFACFADEGEDAQAEYVLRYGPLFRAGQYPDKGLPEVTAADIAQMAARFAPVAMDLQHTDTILDGSLGHVVAVEVAETDPELLCGTVAVPQWLAPLLPEQPPVSAAVRLADKALTGLSWVLQGRVPEAVLTEAHAAFAARRHTYSGQSAIQRMHDIAAESGAVCASGSAKLHARHEAEALQQMHDTAVAHGALCATIREANSPHLPFNATEPNILRAHSPAGFAAGPTPKEDRMGFWDQFKATFGLPTEWTPPAGVAEPAAPPPPPAPGSDPTRDEVARLAAENRHLRQEKVQAAAERFADKAIEQGKAFPCERVQLCAAFAQAAMDDAQLGTVATFDGQTQSRVGLWEASVDARPAYKLTDEQLKGGVEYFALQAALSTPKPGEGPMPPERRKALHGVTPLGRATLNGENHN